MEQDPAQQIQKRLAELPEDIRASIQSADLDKKLEDIGKRRQLHIDQVGELQDEVFLVMLGFSEPSAFEGRLAEALHIAPEAAQQLSADINTKVFLPIRESMKKFAERAATPPNLPSQKSSDLPSAPKPGAAGQTFVQKDSASSLHAAELMLSEKTASIAPKAAPYKTDPYREPPE